ncbi:MAG: F0F1 ATP synthase subunit A [Saprospirales bacterium]|nr:F0F1 ATP synthase subunit A [Saprospirales bacterium]
MRSFSLIIGLLLSFLTVTYGQDQHGDQHSNSASHAEEASAGQEGHGACGCLHDEEAFPEYNPTASAFQHIGDANAFHVAGDFYIPLPCILYAPDHGWTLMMANKFEAHHHGNGSKAIDRYVLVHGEVKRIADTAFPKGEVEIECISHVMESVKGKEVEMPVAVYGGTCYALENRSTLDGGVFGGGITSFYDFSITKNVFTMLLVLIFFFLVFRSVAKTYQARRGQAPKGLQGFMEPIVLFIQDEVAKPFIGARYDKYLPFLLSIFFFILGLNLIGQIPFFPGSGNVTGNLGVTMVLALFVFVVVNINGNKNYWKHIFWMPGVPAPIKLILTPVEVLGLFIKPFTLMLRLFANITAGHIVVLSFVGLIFIFGKSGASMGGSLGGAAASIPLTMFIMAIELLVAFIQAFVFTLLTASYIGAAIEEDHH